jgi:hypothetical protein
VASVEVLLAAWALEQNQAAAVASVEVLLEAGALEQNQVASVASVELELLLEVEDSGASNQQLTSLG